MRLARTLAVLAMTVSAAPWPAHAAPGTASATYVATPGIKADASEASQPYGYGGYQFTPSGDPVSIKVVDLDGPDISWYACQEGPSQTGENPGQCGGGDDRIDTGCSNNRFQAFTTNFRPGAPVDVFVFASNPGVWNAADCDGVGVGGTVTLKWS
jgi:hypothetical protein